MNKFIVTIIVIATCLMISTTSQASSLRAKADVVFIKKNQKHDPITSLRPEGEFDPVDCEYLTLLTPPNQWVCNSADTKCKTINGEVYLVEVITTTRPECESTGGTVL